MTWIFENFGKKNGEKDNLFQKFLKYIEFPILEVKITYIFQVVLIRGSAYRAQSLYIY